MFVEILQKKSLPRGCWWVVFTLRVKMDLKSETNYEQEQHPSPPKSKIELKELNVKTKKLKRNSLSVRVKGAFFAYVKTNSLNTHT